MTPKQFRRRQIEKYRDMSGDERLLIGLQLHQLSCEIARDAIRARFPAASPSQIEEKLTQRLRLAYAHDRQGEYARD